MSRLPDFIVYIWLLPVVAQIILPLGLFGAWLAFRPVSMLMPRQATADSTTALNRGAAKTSA
jgi:hypothetical protein